MVYAPPFLAMPGGGSWTAWNAQLFILGLLVLFAVTLVYMLGMALNHASLKLWAKGEFMQVFITFLLAISAVAMIGVLWSLLINGVTYVYATTSPSQDLVRPQAYFDPFSFDQAFIEQVLIDCEKTVYRAVYLPNLYYRAASRLSTEIIGAEALGGWYATVYAGFFEYVAGHINNLLLLNYLQIRLLSLLKYASPLFIQLGLLLRVFPLTRGSGGLLMAIGFGFFAVYPISLALLMTLQPPSSLLLCGTTFHPPAMLGTDPFCGNDIGAFIQARYSLLATQNGVSILLEQIKLFLPVFWIQSIFLPMVALIVTFTFIRQTGSLLGADLAEIGRGLIKLI